MPLTFAHPAAVLPLRRLRLPLSALVVGSMAPDLIYFVRLAPRGHFGHTPLGLILWCLPAGLAVLWLFHRILKQPLATLLPPAARRRLDPYLRRSPFDGPFMLVAVGVLLGAVTHDVWDAFTHAGGVGVEAIPVLQRRVALGALGSVPVYTLAQHGSTLAAFVVLGIAGVAWWRRAPETDVASGLPLRVRAVRLVLLMAVPLVAGTAFAAVQAAGASSPLPVFAGRFVIATTTVAFVLALAYSVWAERSEAPR